MSQWESSNRWIWLFLRQLQASPLAWSCVSFMQRWAALNAWFISDCFEAESRNWLRLLQPPTDSNGWVDATGTLATVQLDALGELTTDLQIGHESLAVGTYEAEIVISQGVGEDVVIPVSFSILGSPYLPESIFNGMLDFGVVPLGGEGRRTVRLWNYGNGTARVKLAPLSSPFAGPLVEARPKGLLNTSWNAVGSFKFLE